MSAPTADPRQQAQNRMMQWMMPGMFAFFTLSFPSGLAIFWVASGVVRIVAQYLIGGGSSFDFKGMFGRSDRDSKMKKQIEISAGKK